MLPDYRAGSPYHRRRQKMAPHTVRCLDAAITLLGRPASLLDLGCGEGALVRHARARDIDAVGVDVAADGTDPALVYADLCQPLDLGRRFDWVTCWEVGEHLPPTAGARLVHTIAHHVTPGGRVLFTAARRGQRGPGHINCQAPLWWAHHFAAYGLTLAVEPSADLRRAWATVAPRCPWYGQNAQLFWRVA
jgi:2-polyprenyl-3-methyl-5-hydroxy-6-metoxy-1,4-benzoquinol methylase